MPPAPPPSLPWLTALADPATYPHPVGPIELIHTHLSVVALTGEYAYKLKKPVNYGFADFSTLARREQFCQEEFDRNRRFAPDLYLGVVRLKQTPAGWRFESADPPTVDSATTAAAEPAVRMRQFAAADRLDVLTAQGRLTGVLADALADTVAAMHAALPPVASADAATYPARLAHALAENFRHLPAAPATTALEAACTVRLQAVQPLLAERAQHGWVRDCHGDLHLSNLCLWHGRPTPFDCIEFNPHLTRIDVLSDAAFLFMDLCARGHAAEAQQFLNHYLEHTGDYAGLPAWPVWVAYRATVRAKIAHLTLTAPGVPTGRQAALESERDRYLALAADALAPQSPPIVLMVGLPASGKSTAALRFLPGVANRPPGLRVRSDVERTRLFATATAAEKYAPASTAKVYATLLTHARAIHAAGYTPVLDATYLTRVQRAPVLALAQELRTTVQIIHCEAPIEELHRRLQQRQAAGRDPSEADEKVLDLLAARFEPFTPAEAACVTHA